MSIGNKTVFEAIGLFNEYANCMEANNVDIGLQEKGTWVVFGEWFTAERLAEIEKKPETLGL